MSSEKQYALIDENDVVLTCVIVSEDDLQYLDDIISSNGASIAIEYTQSEPAYIGGTWNGEYFAPPQPYLSWTLETVTLRQWVPPVPAPLDNKPYVWDEETLSWVEFTDTTPTE